MPMLGIDLGTTFSLAAYVNAQGVPVLVPDYHDANAFRTPSVVYIGPEGALVGDAVEEILDDEPELNQVRFMKQTMGEKQALYRDFKSRDWLPQSLSAVILKKLMNDVEAFLHENVEGVTIAVPANFNDEQRKATKQAAVMAGLPSPALIEEPIAAATFYGYSETTNEQTLFVYDLGGGTFDATVIQTSENGLYALATEGDNQIGGKDVDELIMSQVASEYERVYQENPLTDPIAANQIRRFATSAKLSLSKPGKSQLRKTLLIAGKPLDFVITKLQFQQMLQQLIDRSISVCERCLSAAGLDWLMLDKILLTGGSSLLPLVIEKVSQASGLSASAIICKQPHQAVAYGTALIAEQRNHDNPKSQLQRINSYDLGIRVRDKSSGAAKVQVLIEKNTPIPSSASMLFYTQREDQKRMVFEVVQQKEAGIQEQSMGHFCFMIEQPRKNYPVELFVSYDLEGMVSVKALDPETGNSLERQMDQEGDALDEQLIKQQSWLRSLTVNV